MAPIVMEDRWIVLDNGTRLSIGRIFESWDESKHPRDGEGQFSDKPDVRDDDDGDDEHDRFAKDKATRGPMERASRDKEGRWVAAGGGDLPDHVPKAIPPGWSDVEYTTDPDADVVITAMDAKGRSKTVYSESWEIKAAELKFARVNELRSKERFITAQIDKGMESEDPKVREAAHCLRLIQSTGLRPGSDKDTKADQQAYGATTLEGRHVVELKSGVRLRFVGKKGVSLDIHVEDKEVAKMLLDRAAKVGRKGKLFDISAGELNEYSRTLDGGHFTAKDFRTARGTNLAIREIGSMEPPTNEKEYKQAVRNVGDVVSQSLGNTRVVALQAYVDPAVFAKWRARIQFKPKKIAA